MAECHDAALHTQQLARLSFHRVIKETKNRFKTFLNLFNGDDWTHLSGFLWEQGQHLSVVSLLLDKNKIVPLQSLESEHC